MEERSASALTPADEHLVAYIREGLYDAEIAVRLGITNRDVKERVERLVTKLGVRDRAELRRAAPRPAEPGPPAEERPLPDELALRRPARGPVYPALFVVAFLAVAMFVMFTFLWPAKGSLPAAAGPSPVVPLPVAIPAPSVVVPTVRIAGRDMIYLGRLLGPPPAEAGTRAEAREDLLVVDIPAEATVHLGTLLFARMVRASPDEATIELSVNGGPFYLYVQAAAPAYLAFGGGANEALIAVGRNRDPAAPGAPPGSPGVVAGPEDRRGMVLWAPAGKDLEGSPRHLELTATGELYAESASRSAEATVFATGEALDLSMAERVGYAPVGGPRNVVNECRQSAPCQTFVYADGPAEPGATYELPANGRFTCREDGVLQLELASFRLFFHQVDGAGKDTSACSTAEENTQADGRVQPVHAAISSSTHYRITAETLAGAVLSVVVGGDRTIYVGAMTPRFGCPCRSGN
jgi:DNA-binding CsgD family transcriptional regulator